MKLKKAVKKTKQYIYKGLVVTIPKRYKYIATDESGAVYLFALQPKTNHIDNSWEINNDSDAISVDVLLNQISDWDKSLMKVSDLKIYKHPKPMSDKDAVSFAIGITKLVLSDYKAFKLDEKLEAIEQDRDDAIKLYYGSKKR